jgi:putative transcriptional regulator
MTRKRKTKPSPLSRRIISGLTDLRDALRDGAPLGERFTVRTVEISDPQRFDAARVRALRDTLNMSQQVFAQVIGVSTVLVRSWEQGVRTPSPLARRLLAEVEERPHRWRAKVSVSLPPKGAPPRTPAAKRSA